MRADGEITKDYFLNKSTEIETRIKTIEDEVAKLMPQDHKKTQTYAPDERIALFKYYLMQSIYPPDGGDIPEDVIRAFVSKIIVHEDSFDWYFRFVPEMPLETLKISGNRQNSANISSTCDTLRRLRFPTNNILYQNYSFDTQGYGANAPWPCFFGAFKAWK